MKTPGLLDSIGLCLSGGGYRATAFSLGVLSYLNKVKSNEDSLLKNVEAISMVSGGSITGAFYTDANYRGEDFNRFYRRMYAFLSEDRLCEDALVKLKKDDIWNSSHKKRSLINAFALTYKDHLGLQTFADLHPGSATHLKDVCINATELAYGLTFRFQNNGTFGIEPRKSTYLEKLRGQFEISDAIASSTCFPFVFEPMVLPDDYIWNKNQPDYVNLKNEEKYKEGIGIMDGGIVDNQGIGSIIKIDRLRDKPLDAFIICDVDSYQMDQWLQSEEEQNEKRSRWSIKYFISKYIKPLKLNWYHGVIPLIGVGLICLAKLRSIGDLLSSGLFISGGVLLGVGILIFLFGLIFSKLVVEIIQFAKDFYRKKLPDKFLDELTALKTLELGTVKRVISERWTSTLTTVGVVFPNQIRRLNYRLLNRTAEFKDKSISVRVYQLNGKDTLGEPFVPNPTITLPSDVLIQSALTASQMPTSLWWDQEDIDKERLKNLLACGQYTTCYNLLDYLIKNHVGETDILRKQLTEDWEQFLKNPLYLWDYYARLIT